jgi:beta-lactam-binding protein with PASTA domain
LSNFTSHGQKVKVPDFTGKKIENLDEFVSDKSVSYLIIDSVYDTKTASGTVIRQEPEPASEVKEGRTIYLYVTTKLPPSILMPKLIDRSLRQAMSMITSYGLKLGNIKYIPDQCVNCILGQQIKGKNVDAGEPIKKGEVINLIVGKGLGSEETDIPCLFGLTRKEAIQKLSEYSLSIGAVSFDVAKDSSTSKVYKQLPDCRTDKMIRMGTSIDLFFTTDKSKIPVVSNDSVKSKKVKDENFDEE